VLVGDFLHANYERSKLYDPSFTTGFRTGASHDGHSLSPSPSAAGRWRTALAAELERGWRARRARLGRESASSLAEWTRQAFAGPTALVFVGASGIAVRAVAPHLAARLTDPAVVVVDE
jgi:hypothetical protein